MTVPLHQLATDWTGQTYEQRLLLCVETLFAHGEIDRDQYDCLLAQIEARAAFERMAGSPRRSATLDPPGRPRAPANHQIPEFESHTVSSECWCGPELSSDGNVWIHNSSRLGGHGCLPLAMGSLAAFALLLWATWALWPL